MVEGTYFAPPERDEMNEILKQNRILKDRSTLQEVIDSLPNPIFIINEHRQVVLPNEELLNMLDLDNENRVLGKRPGEIFNCIYSQSMEGGCGTSKMCQFCGVITAVMESRKEGRKIAKESRLVTDQNGIEVHLDMLVSSSLIHVEGDRYFMVSMIDLTSQKRKEVFEKVFLHDFSNTAQGLLGSLYKMRRDEEKENSISLLGSSMKITESLIDDITHHRSLIAAEKGDLDLTISNISSENVIDDVINVNQYTLSSNGRQLKRSQNSQNIQFRSDKFLLKRVLINMVKNALEASDEGGSVEIGSFEKDGNVLFKVTNEGMIPFDVQAQLWQRSFSTKGSNRGIGTYSMKLFTEQYMGGRIYFSSSETEGTTFTLSLPKEPSK